MTRSLPRLGLHKIFKWLSQGGPDSVKHRGILHPIIVLTIHYVVTSTVIICVHDYLLSLLVHVQYFNTTSTTTSTEMECLLSSSSSSSSMILQDQEQQEQEEDLRQLLLRRQLTVAKFLTLYILWYFGFRLKIQQQQQQEQSDDYQQQQQKKNTSPNNMLVLVWTEFYRQTFLCSGTLVMSCVGFWTERPIVASAHIVAVGIDQILWYVDLLGYFCVTRGKFIIGCTRYLFWDGTTWSSRLTSTHHLWTIPLVLWACRGVNILALPLSFVVVTINVLLSRWLTPIRIDFPPRITDDKETKSPFASGPLSSSNNDKSSSSPPPPPPPPKTTTSLYLNLNLAHECWSDISFEFLRWGEESIPYLIRLLVVWFICNALVYGLLLLISWTIFGATNYDYVLDTNDISYQCANKEIF